MAMNTRLNMQVIVRSGLREMADQDLIRHDDFLALSDLLEKAVDKHFKRKLDSDFNTENEVDMI